MKDILQEITRLRLERGWSEYDLAKNSGMSQSTISTWYRKKQTPTIQSLDKVCAGLGISLSQFFAEGTDAIVLTNEQKELLDNWSALNKTQRKIVIQLLENM
ncbi:helix-turn-helix domain-containing protein [Flintibacter muris]|uniref:helix-turn-helix domain-containing protein n=1 Tax=Flintibacter muris TaxID=2941327 RepID=UPI0020405207|nr:helix-turn-helix transcriptional regulator [Flintibacter muris]